MEDNTNVNIYRGEYNGLVRDQMRLYLLFGVLEKYTEYKFIGEPYEGLALDDRRFMQAVEILFPEKYMEINETKKKIAFGMEETCEN